MAYALGEKAKEIKTGKYLFAAGLLLPIGKVLMTCLFPKTGTGNTWPDFLAEVDRAGDRRFDYLRFLEPKKFPTTHAELSSLFVNFGGILRVIEKALYFYQDPEPLKKASPDLYNLATLLSLATRMASTQGGNFKFEPFQNRWMSYNRLTPEQVQAAAAAAQRGAK